MQARFKAVDASQEKDIMSCKAEKPCSNPVAWERSLLDEPCWLNTRWRQPYHDARLIARQLMDTRRSEFLCSRTPRWALQEGQCLYCPKTHDEKPWWMLCSLALFVTCVKQETTWDRERCQVVSLVWWLNLKCEKTCDWWESSSFKLPDVFQDRMSCASQVVVCWSLWKRLIQPQVLATEQPMQVQGLHAGYNSAKRYEWLK